MIVDFQELSLPSELAWIIIDYVEFSQGYLLLLLEYNKRFQDFFAKTCTFRNFPEKFFTFIGGKPQECTMEYWIMVEIIRRLEWVPEKNQREALMKLSKPGTYTELEYWIMESITRRLKRVPEKNQREVLMKLPNPVTYAEPERDVLYPSTIPMRYPPGYEVRELYSYDTCRASDCSGRNNTHRCFPKFQLKYYQYLGNEQKTATDYLCEGCLSQTVIENFLAEIIPLHIFLAFLLKLTDKCSTQNVPYYNGVKCPVSGCDHAQARDTYISGYANKVYDRRCQCCQYQWFATDAIRISKGPKNGKVHYASHRYVKECPECECCNRKFCDGWCHVL